MYSEPCARLTRSMMPKTSVSPAANRKSSMPSWMPLRHCSRKYSIGIAIASPPPGRGRDAINTAQRLCATAKARCRPFVSSHFGSLPDHALLPQFDLATVVERVLIVLEDGGHGLEHVVVALFHQILQVEILDRNMVVAELEVAAQRLEVGLFHRLAQSFFVRQIAMDGGHRAVEQRRCVVGLGAVIRRPLLVLGDVFGDELLVLVVGNVVHPF